MSRGTTAPGRTFGDRARSPALASFLLDCLCTGGLGVGGREACPPGQPCRMGAGVFSPRSQVGTCGPSLKPAHPLVGRLAMFILEIHWGALGCMGSLQVAVAGQGAGTGATCVPELCRGQEPVSAEISGWGSLSPMASLAARGVWCPVQAASFPCRVLRTSSELLFSSCSRPSSLSCETRRDPFSSCLRPCVSPPPPALTQPSLLPCPVGQWQFMQMSVLI